MRPENLQDHPDFPALRDFFKRRCNRAWLRARNAHGVGIGYGIEQTKNDEETDKLCIQLFVEHKRKDAPEPLKLDGVTHLGRKLNTDVYETPRARLQLDLRQRPVLGGASCSLLDVSTTGVTGTMGGWVRDRHGREVMLSNAHVLGCSRGQVVIQHGMADFGGQEERVGRVSQTRRFRKVNHVDCALALPDDPHLYDPTDPRTIAIRATAEVTKDMAVEKYGKGTGYTTGRVWLTEWKGWVDAADHTDIYFDDVILVRSDHETPWSTDGDSGSLVFCQTPGVDGIKPVVGVHFAGTPKGRIGRVCKIKHVFDLYKLNVLP